MDATVLASSGVISAVQNNINQHIEIVHPGSAAVLAFLNDPYGSATQEVLFIEQFRPAINKLVWEVPAGMLDIAGEAPDSLVLRELTEETGYVADYLCYLGAFYVSPGYTNEVTHLYLAHTLRKVQDGEREISVKRAELPHHRFNCLNDFLTDFKKKFHYDDIWDIKLMLCLSMWYTGAECYEKQFQRVNRV